MFQNIVLIFEFIFYYTLFTIGDYSLYYITNKANDLFIRKKTSRISIVVIPNIIDWSISNSVSYGFIYLIYTQKIGLLYFNFDQYDKIYTFISPILFFFLQDFIFYLMHRASHIPILYRNLHCIHHKYKYPQSWTGRISHWLDSNIENVAFTIPALIMPINGYIWKVCLIFTFIWGNFLHDSTNKKRIYGLNDNTDHCLHHSYGEKNYNFSYYFNFWDKIFGTYKKLEINCGYTLY